MKRLIFLFIVVLAAFGVSAQKVVLNDGIRDIRNNATYVVTPTKFGKELQGEFTIKNLSGAAVSFTIASNKIKSVEGTTESVIFGDITVSDASMVLQLGANESKNIIFALNGSNLGATNMAYTIKTTDGSEDYKFYLNFYNNTLNFASSHHDTAGDNLNSPQSAEEVQVMIDEETGSSTIYFNFKNTGETGNFFLTQSFLKTGEGFDNMICKPGQCIVGNATPPFEINGGETIEQTYSAANLGTDVICFTNGNADYARVRYSIVRGTPEAPTADSISWVVKWNATNNGSVGVNDKISNAEGKFSNVYPNPVKNTINIDCKNVEDIVTLTVYNITGSKMIEREMDTYNGKLSVNVSDLKNGLYLYSISVKGETVETKKFVINK